MCPISTALDAIGDKWSLLIIRDLIIQGPRTYSQLLDSPERISTNILATRLELLISLNLIERTKPQASSRNNAFQVTNRGAQLKPVIQALGHWASRNLTDFHSDMLKM